VKFKSLPKQIEELSQEERDELFYLVTAVDKRPAVIQRRLQIYFFYIIAG